MDEVRRFMRLEKAARAEQQMERNRKQVEARIAKLGLSLTADQRTKLVHSYMGFQQRRNAIWSEVKASNEDGEADWPTLIRETRQRIQGEFAERVSAFMPRADADAVASSLYPAGK